MPAPPDPSAAPPGVNLRRLGGLVRPHLRPLLAAGVLLLLQSGVGLVAPRVAGMVVDAALLREGGALLDRVVLALLGLFAVLGVLSFGEHYLLSAASSRMLADLRGRLFA